MAARQVEGILHSVAWHGLSCIFLLREALHEVELSSDFCNGLQKLKNIADKCIQMYSSDFQCFLVRSILKL